MRCVRYVCAIWPDLLMKHQLAEFVWTHELRRRVYKNIGNHKSWKSQSFRLRSVDMSKKFMAEECAMSVRQPLSDVKWTTSEESDE